MCVRIRTAARVIRPWDSDTNEITIPASLTPEDSALAIRAVLSELGIRQPHEGAICWCGARLTPPSIRGPS
ncbi:hypothetical protein GCM10010274_43860 [Streptomyces lavendofoliae]|uniref:Uncharacterized protein n=1 Tax=Streptomyces lavendofoliae TaxID=67314 RepID=A0A918M6E1_9ACTN|nr:hypothetical protein GCM10010274_43860 [Streptomyces lavendofoliae]